MGPDNLWCIGQNQYIMFECKSQVLESRLALSKHEAGQMEEHCAWFEKEYDGMSAMNIMLIPTATLAEDAFFSHDVMIMRKKGLAELKRDISAFFHEFKDFALDSLAVNTVNGWLTTHKLNSTDWLSKYLEKPRKPEK
ncbi:MAG: DEAD/DEAH box helicase, partial [Eubacteriales bacterium]|nr:DEAD/DEAH box helicase [Eubacteriales bacterium]